MTLNRDGPFVYQPDLAFAGTVSFTYVATDGNVVSDPVEVTIDVTPVANPDSPVETVTDETERSDDESGEVELPVEIAAAPP